MINKIRNNTFIKSTFILLFGGALGKLVGFFIKIIITRTLGTTGIGYYSMLGPTMGLITTISTFSMPTAISTLISKNKYNSKDLLLSTLIVSFIINIIIMGLFAISCKYISNNLLKNSYLFLPLLCICLTIPFISVSSIIKGYFWGKQNMLPYILSNFIEQIVRIILILVFIKKIVLYNLVYAICFTILINIIGEISSWVVMLLFAPKNSINVCNFHFNISYIKDLFNIALPATTSKIVGSFVYFLEPIILTNILMYMGYTTSYITYEYGIINAYALSLLLLPQFFTQNMATSLVPELSKYYSQNNYDMCKKRIRQILYLSLSIGLISTCIIVIYPNFFLNLIYNTNLGSDYIKLLAPFTILFYLEYPLISALQALNKSKEVLNTNLITSVIRISSIIVFALLKFGIYSLIISIILNLIFSCLIYYKKLCKVFT